jgi:hypothetical protein
MGVNIGWYLAKKNDWGGIFEEHEVAGRVSLNF